MFRKMLQGLAQSSGLSDSVRLTHITNTLGSVYAGEFQSLMNGRYKNGPENLKRRAEALGFLADTSISTSSVIKDNFKNKSLWQTRVEPSIRDKFDAVGHSTYEASHFYTELLDYSVVLVTIAHTQPDDGVTPYEQLDNFLFYLNYYYGEAGYLGGTPYWWMSSHSQWRNISKSPDTVYKIWLLLTVVDAALSKTMKGMIEVIKANLRANSHKITAQENSSLHGSDLGTLIRVILLGTMSQAASNNQRQSKESRALVSIVDEMYPDFALVAAEYFNSENASSTLTTLKSMVSEDNILNILPLSEFGLSLEMASHIVGNVAYVAHLTDIILDGNVLPPDFPQVYPHLYSLTI